MIFNDTYAHCAPSNNNVSNLLNYARNCEGFNGKEFVVFQDSQYSYYVFWGDLEVNENGVVVSEADSSVDYIRYFKQDTSNYTSSYDYERGNCDSFELRSSYVNTSNIADYGFASSIYDTHKLNTGVAMSLVLALAFLYVIMVTNLKGGRN